MEFNHLLRSRKIEYAVIVTLLSNNNYRLLGRLRGLSNKMSASPVIKEELPDADESDLLCFDDIEDIIRRAESIIQEHRDLNRRFESRNADAAREQALAVLREPLPVIESEQIDTNNENVCLPAACEEENRPAPIANIAQLPPIVESISQEGSAAATVADDDDDDVIFIDEVPNPYVFIDLSTPNPGPKRRRRRSLNNLQNVVITIDTSFETNATLPSPVKKPAPLSAAFSQDPPNTESNTSNSRVSGISCPICLDTCRKPTSTFCGHVFCQKCIKAAIDSVHKCPLCKRKLSSKSIHPLFL